MAFQRFSVPLVKGEDTSDAPLSEIANAASLLAATNVVFTSKGAVRPRPGQVSQDGNVVMFDSGAATGVVQSSLSSPLGTYKPAALHAGADGSVFLQCHGRLIRQGSPWVDAGPCWSARRTTRATARVGNGRAGFTQFTADCGPHLFGQLVTDHGASGWAYYDDAGNLRGPITTTADYADSQTPFCSVAGEAIFWIGTGGDAGKLFGQFVSSWPTATQVTLATNAVASAVQAQSVWAVTDGTNYYVAYITSTQGSVIVLKVSSTGVVLSNTLVYSFGAITVSSVCVAADPVTGDGCLLVTVFTAPYARSKVFSLSTMTDSALDVTWTPTNSTVYGAVVGIVGGTAYCAWNGDSVSGTNSTVDVVSRALNSTTTATLRKFVGSTNHLFQTLFPPQNLAGRPVMGIIETVYALTFGTGPRTWMAVDIGYPTYTLNSATVGGIAPVAAGDYAGTAACARPGSPASCRTARCCSVWPKACRSRRRSRARTSRSPRGDPSS
jgi:hypothetical protein